MSESSLLLEIVTPEKEVLKEEIIVVVLRAAKGYLSAMKGHIPFVSLLKPGILEFIGKKRNLSLYVGGGFVEILPNRIIVAAEKVEEIKDLDFEQLKKLKQEIEEKMKVATPEDKNIFIKYEEITSKLYILEKKKFVL